MDSGNHPDPVSEAMSHGLQRAVQVASSAMTGAQVYLYLKRTQARAVAERDERARRALTAQISADRAEARAGWAPALDAAWLRQADLARTAQAWGAAMPYADRAMPWYEPAAATAMRKCEERLRVLDPHAMARYDQLRAEGMSPAEAMREAAPLFGRLRTAHDAPYQARPILDAGIGENLTWTATGPGQGPAGSGLRPDSSDATGQARVSRSAKPWQHDFPLPIRDVVASSAGSKPAAALPAVPASATRITRPSHPRS